MRQLIFAFALALISVTAIADDQHWPSFRGPSASGIAEGYPTALRWDVEEGENVAWSIPVPGLSHSSPIVWGDRLYLTAAISAEEDDPELRVGLYGDIISVEKQDPHRWMLYAIDKHTGEIEWEAMAHAGIPKSKRHPKSTHANATPATDGKRIVAFFGSEGLYCYDMNGELLWKKDLGTFHSGFYVVADTEWGFASSPIIHEDVVIIQCDTLQQAFVAAYDANTGEELWRAERDEVPTWSTPTIQPMGKKTRVIVNGFKHIGGYDFKTGKELWRLTGFGDVPVPTPIIAHDLIFINDAHGRAAPIYAVRADAKGDITLEGPGERSNKYIAWSKRRGSSYMQTPLVYGDYLFTCRDNGSLSCYDARTGELHYTEKIGRTGLGFSASPVASGGKLYFTSEEGDVVVVEAAPTFNILAENTLGELAMATPAISEGTIYFRTKRKLLAIQDDQ